MRNGFSLHQLFFNVRWHPAADPVDATSLAQDVVLPNPPHVWEGGSFEHGCHHRAASDVHDYVAIQDIAGAVHWLVIPRKL